MFENEAAINQFLRDGLQRVLADIPEHLMLERPPGDGHPPLWVLGHLAICAELGLGLCGQPLAHPEWMGAFGPGSCDEVADADRVAPRTLVDAVDQGYARLIAAGRGVPAAELAGPHGVALLDGSAIRTRGELLAHLLTSHFAFHLAQLSQWRRAAGHLPLF